MIHNQRARKRREAFVQKEAGLERAQMSRRNGVELGQGISDFFPKNYTPASVEFLEQGYFSPCHFF
jgi:hypothetical protein